MSMKAGTEERKMLLEDFELWLRTHFTETFRLSGHKFEKTDTSNILVDAVLFTEDETKQLFTMITSNSPFDRFNATILILERKGTLLKLLVVFAVVALIVIYLRVRR